jgi:transposase
VLELARSERRALEAALKATRDRRHWVRLRGVLLAADGVPVAEIARDLGAGPSTVFGWLAHWRAVRDPAALADAPRSGQPPVLKAAHRARLEQLLGEDPEAHGYKTVGWTVPLLAIHFAEVEGVPVSETTLRRVLHALGYRWKRPRYVLARRDPERAGKKGGARGGGGPRAR